MRAAKLLIIAFLLSSLILAEACKKEEEKWQARSFEYWPYKPGNIRRYIYDSVHYNRILDTVFKFKLIIEEKVTEEFVDNEGRKSLRIEQYVLPDSGKNKEFIALNVLNSDGLGAQRVEQNRRFFKLSFPIRKGREWNGNIFNNLGQTENYKYISVGEAYNNTIKEYNDVAFVQQKNFYDAQIMDSYAMEVYAKDVGLVHRKYREIDLQDNGPNPEDGYEVEWRLYFYQP